MARHKIMPATARISPALKGVMRVPGDKSISHRALMFGALAKGETIISGILEAGDIFSTASALRAMDVKLSMGDDGLWRVQGNALLQEPEQIIDMGNSGTSTRLMAGMVCGFPITVTMTGDTSLIRRPMARVTAPLEQMGAKFLSRKGTTLPMSIGGSASLRGIDYHLPVPSAQVKSAILLAGLNAAGTTIVTGDTPTRDHTEIMLRHFGAEVRVTTLESGAQKISLTGGQGLTGCAIDVPGDASTAAFPAIAAMMVPDSDITLPRINMNPHRNGLYTTLLEMGADITLSNERTEGGEAMADLRIRYHDGIKGVSVPPDRVASMIDEIPALAMVAACATGTTHMTNLSELRVKESDRLAMVANGLSACGIEVETSEDSMTIHGKGQPPVGGAMIETALDHRIAMSFLCLGLATEEPVSVDNISPIMTSFPDFVQSMAAIGADMTVEEDYLDPDGLFLKKNKQLP